MIVILLQIKVATGIEIISVYLDCSIHIHAILITHEASPSQIYMPISEAKNAMQEKTLLVQDKQSKKSIRHFAL